MRDLKPKYDKTERMAMTVKMMAPAMAEMSGDVKAYKKKRTVIFRNPIVHADSADNKEVSEIVDHPLKRRNGYILRRIERMRVMCMIIFVKARVSIR